MDPERQSVASEGTPPKGEPEERRVAGTPHAVAANAAVLALARAARSFTLYDPANKVVRTLIQDYRDKLEKVLSGFGALELAVHPFELLLAGEVVYLEKDRERSLAFRLFRDGVRSLRFEPGATWDELLRLLQILSIRFTGVRQQEDDLVTLLRKADFAHLRVSAIEGFIPEEEDAETTQASVGVARPRVEPPSDWDLPLPAFRETVPLRHRPVPEEALARLREEESAQNLPRHAVRAVGELLRAAAEEDVRAVLEFALEVREFLLLEQRVDLVSELASMIAVVLSARPQASRAFFESYLDRKALDAIVDALPSAEAPPPALAALLAHAPAAAPQHMLERLGREAGGPRSAVLRALLAQLCRGRAEALARRLPEASGGEAVALLQVLAEIEPQAASRRAVEVAASQDPLLQLEAARQLAAIPFAEAARALLHLLQSPAEDVRSVALAALGKGGGRVFQALSAHAEKKGAGLGRHEAEALGKALVEASPREASALFATWLRARGGGLIGRLRASLPPSLQRVALAGLAELNGGEARELLALLASQADPEIADAVAASLRASRAGGAG